MSDWIPRPYRMKVDSIHADGPKQRDIVYRWTAPTYGVVGAREVAVTFQPDEAPFFSVERTALEGGRYVGFVMAGDSIIDEVHEPATFMLVEWVPYD